MLMVIPNSGKVLLLFNAMCAVDTSQFEDWWIDLFQSDTLVEDESVLADFTLATFGGYVRIEQTRALFNSAVEEATYAITGNLATPSWTCTGGAPQTVYGWIMHGQDTGGIYAGQNFDAPRVMSAGAVENISPFDFRLKTLD